MGMNVYKFYKEKYDLKTLDLKITNEKILFLIYDEKYNDYNVLVEHLEQLDHKFDSGSIMLVDTKAFETDKEKELIQLEIIWLFCVEE